MYKCVSVNLPLKHFHLPGGNLFLPEHKGKVWFNCKRSAAAAAIIKEQKCTTSKLARGVTSKARMCGLG